MKSIQDLLSPTQTFYKTGLMSFTGQGNAFNQDYHIHCISKLSSLRILKSISSTTNFQMTCASSLSNSSWTTMQSHWSNSTIKRLNYGNLVGEGANEKLVKFQNLCCQNTSLQNCHCKRWNPPTLFHLT